MAAYTCFWAMPGKGQPGPIYTSKQSHTRLPAPSLLAAYTEDSHGGLAEDFVHQVMKACEMPLNQKVNQKKMAAHTMRWR